MTDDDLDDLLGDDTGPVMIDLDDLGDLVEQAPKIRLDPVRLDDVVQGKEHVSLLTDHSSSIFAGQASKLRFRQLATKNLRERPLNLAKRLWAQDDVAKPGTNPLDSSLNTGRMMDLITALQHAEAQVLEGAEVAIIVKGPQRKELDTAQSLALHLNATPVDGIVFMDLAASDLEVRRALLSRGLVDGADYEIVEALSLLAYERQVLNGLLTARRKPKLRILRRLSKKLAKT